MAEPPALETPPRTQIVEVDDIKDYNKTEASEDQSTSRGDTTVQDFDTETKDPVKSNIIDYADGSSSEDEMKVPSKTQVTHYNDLEELD